MSEEENYELPIDGTLDLPTFHPSDVRELLDDYLEACLEKERERCAGLSIPN